ncbi:hypothetical protein GY45DRAFT_565292 [Cubamyces sp. BRFM 1775]|nr:hypothetical protein GY45DRAFT_565292 [Cubamyces sp. BRFM 1775]
MSQTSLYQYAALGRPVRQPREPVRQHVRKQTGFFATPRACVVQSIRPKNSSFASAGSVSSTPGRRDQYERSPTRRKVSPHACSVSPSACPAPSMLRPGAIHSDRDRESKLERSVCSAGGRARLQPQLARTHLTPVSREVASNVPPATRTRIARATIKHLYTGVHARAPDLANAVRMHGKVLRWQMQRLHAARKNVNAQDEEDANSTAATLRTCPRPRCRTRASPVSRQTSSRWPRRPTKLE